MQYLYIGLFVVLWLGPQDWADTLEQQGDGGVGWAAALQSGKLRHGKGGDCLRSEEKVALVPVLRSQRCWGSSREAAHDGHTMAAQ